MEKLKILLNRFLYDEAYDINISVGFLFIFEKRGIRMAEVSNNSTMLSQEEIDKLIKKLEEEKENKA